MAAFSWRTIEAKTHHGKSEVSGTRAKYRDGRRATAVKVYTVNQESSYLLIQGVPSVGAKEELQSLCEQYGDVTVDILDEYPCEEFTEVYLASYKWFPAARTAKKHLDEKSFFGGTLHVCYAPEFETLDETRRKLQGRRAFVRNRTGQGQGDSSGMHKRKNPEEANSCSSNRSAASTSEINTNQPVTYIWAGKEYTVYPEQSKQEEIIEAPQQKQTTLLTQLLPRSLTKTVKRPSIPLKGTVPHTSSHEGLYKKAR